MSDINVVVCTGRLVSEPEYGVVGAKSTELTKARLAINVGWGDKQRTSFVDLVVWGRLALAMHQRGKKGMRLSLRGELQQETWETQGGDKRSKISIIVREYQFLDPLDAPHPASTAQDATSPGLAFDDEIPF